MVQQTCATRFQAAPQHFQESQVVLFSVLNAETDPDSGTQGPEYTWAGETAKRIIYFLTRGTIKILRFSFLTQIFSVKITLKMGPK